MERNRIGTYLAIAIVAGLIGAFVARSWGGHGGGKCDVDLSLSQHQLEAIKTNLARVRAQAFDTASNDGQNRDAANKAAEDAAFDTFVYNLRGPLKSQYNRHRTAMDGCF